MIMATDTFEVLRRTERALLIRRNGREAWLPASQVRWHAEGLWVPGWLADVKGFRAPLPTGRPTARQRFARECADMARRDAEWAGMSRDEVNAAGRRAYELETV